MLNNCVRMGKEPYSILAVLNALITACDKLIGTIPGNHIPPSCNGLILTASKEGFKRTYNWDKYRTFTFFLNDDYSTTTKINVHFPQGKNIAPPQQTVS
jgi:hypothetical protein